VRSVCVCVCVAQIYLLHAFDVLNNVKQDAPCHLRCVTQLNALMKMRRVGL